MTAAAKAATGLRALGAVAIGIAQTGGVVAAVVGFGLAWAGLAGEDTPSPSYTPAAMELRERWLIDGFNVLHTGVLRGRDRREWWRETARARLLERVACFDAAEAELWVVFDGAGPGVPAEEASERPRVVFAPSADEWLLAAVRRAEDPGALVVVTADRQLADRARHRGARIVSPRAFLARCPLPEPVGS